MSPKSECNIWRVEHSLVNNSESYQFYKSHRRRIYDNSVNTWQFISINVEQKQYVLKTSKAMNTRLTIEIITRLTIENITRILEKNNRNRKHFNLVNSAII